MKKHLLLIVILFSIAISAEEKQNDSINKTHDKTAFYKMGEKNFIRNLNVI